MVHALMNSWEFVIFCGIGSVATIGKIVHLVRTEKREEIILENGVRIVDSYIVQ